MENKIVDVTEVIDSSKFKGYSLSIAIMMILIMLSDGFDLFLMGYVSPAIVQDWGISAAEVQPVNFAGLLGMMIGSVGLGWAGDVIGRKKAYVSCLALLFLGAIFCYQAQNVDQLYWWRLVMGLGLGGVTPLATTLVAEWTNKRIRSVVVACVIVAVPLGGTLGGFVDTAIVHEPEDWRNMFLVGAIIPLVLFAVFTFTLPESPKFMAKHKNMHNKLAKNLNKLLAEKRFDGTEDFIVHEPDNEKAQGFWLLTLFNSHFARSTILIWIAFAVNSFVLYMFTNNLPLLLEDSGVPEGPSGWALQAFSFGAFLGSIGGAYLIGKFGSRYVGTTLAAIGAVSAVLLTLVLAGEETIALILLLVCLAGGASVNGMQAFMYAVSSHSYPSNIRGSAIGIAQTFSRFGALASPLAAGWFFESDLSLNAFLFMLAGVICLTTISFFLIPSHIPRND